jgi:hypothetical protein
VAASARIQVPWGKAWRALAIISGELSNPTMRAFGHLSRKTRVLFPGPQPMSMMVAGSMD